MTDWSNVEFASTLPKSRKAQDLLPILSDILVFWDLVACVAAGAVALLIYARFELVKPMDFSASGPFWRDILFGSLIAALALRDPASLCGHPDRSMLRFTMKAECRCLVAFAILIFVGIVTRATGDLARLWLAGWLLLFAVAVMITRVSVLRYLQGLDRRGELRETVAIVGSPEAGDRLVAQIASEARIVGRYCGHSQTGTLQASLDDFSALLELARNGGVDSVIVALEQEQVDDISHMIDCLKALPIQVAVCRHQGGNNLAMPQMRLLGGLPMSIVADRPLKRWNLVTKALFDKVGALALLVMLAPLMLAISLCVGISSPGPIIFRQQRQGWSGKRFVVFKFRTMRNDTSGRPASQTRRHDARCTRLGRTLRSCSLDELPQLWNVLCGDMSLVGPRPHVDSLHNVDRAGREIVAEYAQRNRMKPGITGWAQVNGARGATATLDQLRRRIDYDLYYIENWSLWLDIKILMLTPFSLMGENVF